MNNEIFELKADLEAAQFDAIMEKINNHLDDFNTSMDAIAETLDEKVEEIIKLLEEIRTQQQ